MKLLSIFLSLSLIIFSQQAEDAIAIDAKVSEVTAGSNVACTIIFTLTSDTSTTKKTIGKIGGLVLAKSSDATSTTPLTCTLASPKEISVGANEFSCTAGTLAEGKYKLAKSTTAGEYKITTDADKKVITLDFYTNPTAQSVSKKIYKVLTEAKNADGKSLFTMSECSSIQLAIKKSYDAG